MTTAHRPTFDPARGKDALRGEAYHQRLLPAHKTLKFRQATQGAPNEHARRDFAAELLRKEAKHLAEKEGRIFDDDNDDAQTSGTAETRLAIEESGRSDDVAPLVPGTKRKLDTAKEDPDGDTSLPSAEVDGRPNAANEEEDYETKKRRVLAETHAIDADSDLESDQRSNHSSAPASESDSDASDSDSDSDEEDAVQRELAKIRAERAVAVAAKAAAQAAKDQEAREREIALGNPLLNGPPSAEYGVKRRWDDDVVFRNQARGTEDKHKSKRFVNDLLRSDFHRKFMDKYVR